MKTSILLFAILSLTLATTAIAKKGNASPAASEFSTTMNVSCTYVKYNVWSNSFCKDTRLIYLKDCTISEAAANQFGQIIHTEKTLPELVLGTGYLGRCYPEKQAKILDQYFQTVQSGTILNVKTRAQFGGGKAVAARIDLVDSVIAEGLAPLKTTENGGKTIFDPLYELFYMDPAAVGDWLP